MLMVFEQAFNDLQWDVRLKNCERIRIVKQVEEWDEKLYA